MLKKIILIMFFLLAQPLAGVAAATPATQSLWNAIAAGTDSKGIKDLLTQGADANAKNLAGDTAIIMAYKQVKMPIVDLLLQMAGQAGTKEMTPDLNAKDANGETLFHLAIERSDLDTLKKLFSASSTPAAMANPNSADNKGITPLVEAVSLGSIPAIIDELVVQGSNTRTNVNLNAKDKSGMTAFRIAAQKGNFDATKKLAQAGASTDGALLDAVNANNPAAVDELLKPDYKINVNAQQANREESYPNGNTALHTAAEKNYLDVAHKLIEHGANPDILNSWYDAKDDGTKRVITLRKQTALDLATSKEMKDYLEPLTKVKGSNQQDVYYRDSY